MKIGNYDVGNDEKTTRRLFKHAVAANVKEGPSLEARVKNYIGGNLRQEKADNGTKQEPIELKITQKDDGFGNSKL